MVRPYRKYALAVFYLIWLLIYGLILGPKILGDSRLVTVVDFLATYTAVQIVSSGNGADLYDFGLQKQIQSGVGNVVLPPDDVLPFIHPPFFVLPFLPLAGLPYKTVYLVVVGVNLLLLGTSLQLLSSRLAGLSSISKATIFLGGYSFFPYIVNLMQGQNGALTLLLFSGVFLSLKKREEMKSGILLGLTLYKPQLCLLFALYLLVKRHWRAVFAFVATGFILVVVSYAVVGLDGFIAYTNLTVLDTPLVDGAYGINYLGMHNWRAFFRFLFGPDQTNQVIRLANWASLITLGLLVVQWRKRVQPTQDQFDLLFALILLATLLISPHLNTHDLTVWLLIGLLIINYLQLHYPYLLNHPAIIGVIVLASLIVLITLILGAALHLQFAVLFMVFLFLGISYHLQKTSSS